MNLCDLLVSTFKKIYILHVIAVHASCASVLCDLIAAPQAKRPRSYLLYLWNNRWLQDYYYFNLFRNVIF